MKQSETIELIKGTFTLVEARELLLQLLNDKINFHNLKNWSSRERFGKPDSFSESRLQSLNESKQKVETLFAGSFDKDRKVTINSTIEITLE